MSIEILIEKSSLMDGSVNKNEHSIIRVPSKLRISYNLPLYSFLNLKTSKNTKISLQVLPAYSEDSIINSHVVYVTTETYNKIDIKKSNLTPVGQITLGCDPELFIIDHKTLGIIDASNFFHKAGEVGCDGKLLEIRPLPSIDSGGVFEYIKFLLTKANLAIKNKKISNALLIGASYYGGLPAGFHIHFGIPPQLLDPSVYKIKVAINKIVNILDFYIGIPSTLAEGGDNALRRSGANILYGKPGNYRLYFPTLEYRVPGGLLLAHPILTKGLLSMSLVVIRDILSRIKLYTNNFLNLEYLSDPTYTKDVYPNTIDIVGLFNIICNPDPAPALKIIDKIFKDVESMLTYSEEKNNIIDFYNFILNNKLITSSITHNWGLNE